MELVRRAYRDAGLAARVEPFLFAMDREMKQADVIVCRAGATTLAELTAAGRPSILIPLPTATDDHQRKNAQALVTQGAAQMIEQRELTGERLAADIVALAAATEAGRRGMARGARPRRMARRRTPRSDRRCCWRGDRDRQGSGTCSVGRAGFISSASAGSA